MVNLPYLAVVCMEAVVYFHSNFVLWDVHLAPAAIKFNSLKAMKALGQVDSIVCSKSAFVNASHQYVAAFKIDNKKFMNKESQQIQTDNTRANDGDSLNSSFDSL